MLLMISDVYDYNTGILDKKMPEISLSNFSLLLECDLYFVQFSHSVVSNSLQTMDCSAPGFPVLHCLLEFAQTQVH